MELSVAVVKAGNLVTPACGLEAESCPSTPGDILYLKEDTAIGQGSGVSPSRKSVGVVLLRWL